MREVSESLCKFIPNKANSFFLDLRQKDADKTTAIVRVTNSKVVSNCW